MSQPTITPDLNTLSAEFRRFIDSGIYDLPADRYHADPCPTPSLSSSIAKILLDQSPQHAWHAHPRLNPAFEREHDTKFDIGTAAHQLLLERRHDGIVIVNADDWRTKAAKEAREAAWANGQTPMLAYQYDKANLMVAAAQQFVATTELSGIFELGVAEQTVIWQEGDIWCRCRPDLRWLHGVGLHIVLDYKTTECAEQETFIRQIGRMRYHIQAEFYTRGVKTVTESEPVFVFLAQETSAPYACSLVGLSNAYRAIGQQKVERAIGLWKHCLSTQDWPSYSTRIAYAEPPAWDLATAMLDVAPTEESAE